MREGRSIRALFSRKLLRRATVGLYCMCIPATIGLHSKQCCCCCCNTELVVIHSFILIDSIYVANLLVTCLWCALVWLRRHINCHTLLSSSFVHYHDALTRVRINVDDIYRPSYVTNLHGLQIACLRNRGFLHRMTFLFPMSLTHVLGAPSFPCSHVISLVSPIWWR